MKQEPALLPIDHPAAFERAVSLISSGGLIAFPTDTVYGIGGSAFLPRAIDEIYRVKERSHLKAIPILLADSEDLEKVTPQLTEIAQNLIEQFWPGALTLILPLLPSLPENLSPGPTVGVRIPDHELTRHLLRKTGPLAATSANLAGAPPALTAELVHKQLGGRVSLILDGGRAPGGVPSTVIDCTGGRPELLREGPLAWREIEEFLATHP